MIPGIILFLICDDFWAAELDVEWRAPSEGGRREKTQSLAFDLVHLTRHTVFSALICLVWNRLGVLDSRFRKRPPSVESISRVLVVGRKRAIFFCLPRLR